MQNAIRGSHNNISLFMCLNLVQLLITLRIADKPAACPLDQFRNLVSCQASNSDTKRINADVTRQRVYGNVFLRQHVCGLVASSLGVEQLADDVSACMPPALGRNFSRGGSLLLFLFLTYGCVLSLRISPECSRTMSPLLLRGRLAGGLDLNLAF